MMHKVSKNEFASIIHFAAVMSARHPEMGDVLAKMVVEYVGGLAAFSALEKEVLNG